MAKKKKTEDVEQKAPINDPEGIFPNGTHLGIVQLPRDLMPKPSAQRIVQWVNRMGELRAYVTESAYHRTELITWYDKLMRLSYQNSISRGSYALTPVKGRIHWCRFTEKFTKTGKGERINPETDLPEEPEK